jgi:hypothetical protein
MDAEKSVMKNLLTWRPEDKRDLNILIAWIVVPSVCALVISLLFLYPIFTFWFLFGLIWCLWLYR